MTSRRECQVGRKEALQRVAAAGASGRNEHARSDAPAFVVRAIGSFSKAGSFGKWVQSCVANAHAWHPCRPWWRSPPASEAPGITSFNSTIATYRLSGTTAWIPFRLSYWRKPMRKSATR